MLEELNNNEPVAVAVCLGADNPTEKLGPICEALSVSVIWKFCRQDGNDLILEIYGFRFYLCYGSREKKLVYPCKSSNELITYDVEVSTAMQNGKRQLLALKSM